MVIAIDGPGAVGKTTVSRRVAQTLGYGHLETGSFYRAGTLAALRAAVRLDDEEAVWRAVSEADIDFKEGTVYLNGEQVTAALRSPEVTAAVSAVSAIAPVRAHLVEQQRAWVDRHDGDAVVEGRDIGTVVFPDAPVKVFLTASVEVRAARRSADAEARGRSADAIADDLRRRDAIDSSRQASPLRAAGDARVIDTSDLSIADVVARVLEVVEAASSGD